MFRWKLPILALLLLIGACSGTISSHKWVPTVGGIERQYGDEIATSQETSIAYGKIVVLQKGKPKTWETPSCKYLMKWECQEDSFEVVIYPQDGWEPLRHMLSNDGAFQWKLQPGTYTLMGYRHVRYINRQARSFLGRIAAEFVVPRQEDSVYLGTLLIQISNGRYAISVVDESDKATSVFVDDSVESKAQQAKSLFEIDQTDDFESMSNICSPEWGLNCDDDYRGVIPLSPTVERDNFPKTESLSPQFIWEPSPQKDISYDLIIYEAANLLTVGHKDYFPGQIVKYVKGITGNKFQLDTKLKEKTKYYWSVRLRKNDNVSNWSVFSYRYFAFFIVGYASGYGSGILFNFETP